MARYNWGSSYVMIQGLLKIMLEESKNLEKMLLNLLAEKSSFSYRYPIDKDPVEHRSLEERARDLARHIDESVQGLCIYSNSVLSAFGGFEPLQNQPAEADQLLRLAAESRAASQKLYALSLIQREDCNIELNLRGASGGICYRLVTEPGQKTLQQVFVESVKEIDASSRDPDGNIEFAKEDAQIFKPSHCNKVVEAPPLDAAPLGTVPPADMDSPVGTDSPVNIMYPPIGIDGPSYLRIRRERPAAINVNSNPECLAEMLSNMERRAGQPHRDYMNKGAKLELAFKIVECGLFLLGSPLFISLSSKHIRRFAGGQSNQPTFMLQMAKLPPGNVDVVHVGHQEISQLFRLGFILMEIALETPETEARADMDCELDSSEIRHLVLVERAMGEEYRRVTAFCLCYRSYHHHPKRELKRSREGTTHADWQEFLQDFLLLYHSRVYCE
ncbi:MAG: hypothetical protein Q9195_003252 [Heterodermia aff. obscurata]